MAILQIDTADLMAKSQSVESTLTRIQTDVNSMEAQLRQLQESWKGSASTAFQEVLTQWRGTQQQVRASLDSIGQVLGAAGSQYAEAEANATRMFS